MSVSSVRVVNCRSLVSVKVLRLDHQYLYAVFFFFFFRRHVSLGAVIKGVKKRRKKRERKKKKRMNERTNERTKKRKTQKDN